MVNEKILVIDDERVMTQLLKVELEKEGYKVSVAYDGKSGLEKIKIDSPDLVILDVIMPTLDGYRVLKILKEDPATKNIPVIMLTVKGFDEEIQKGLDLGADEYMPKPFHPGLLIKRIKNIIELKRGAHG